MGTLQFYFSNNLISLVVSETYGELLKKAKGDVAALPIICTAIAVPGGETIYRIDDIIGEVHTCRQ